jgi:hypothetical protein
VREFPKLPSFLQVINLAATDDLQAVKRNVEENTNPSR